MSIAEYVSYSVDKGADQGIYLGKEGLNTLEISGLPSLKFKLKKDMAVMLMRKVTKKKDFGDGTRLIVQKLSGNFLFTINSVTNEESNTLKILAQT